MSEKKYDLFISHASEDKDEIVRPLATILEKLSVCVWYDEFSLQLGDSLSVSIDKGLQESRFGLLVLSKAFIAKNWTDYEYRSLLTRQNGGEKVILPLWYGIDADEVKKYSLYLGGIKALSITKETLGKAVDAILQVVRPDIWKELRMRSFLKKKIAEAEPKVMKVSDIKMQTTRQSQLTPQQLVRSKAVYYGIGKHFNYSFDRCVELYELDFVPEREHNDGFPPRDQRMFPIGNFFLAWKTLLWQNPPCSSKPTMKSMKEIGAFVTATRKRQGATQLDLAQLSGVGRRFVVELESGKDSLHAGKVLRVLETLGIGLTLDEPRGL